MFYLVLISNDFMEIIANEDNGKMWKKGKMFFLVLISNDFINKYWEQLSNIENS